MEEQPQDISNEDYWPRESELGPTEEEIKTAGEIAKIQSTEGFKAIFNFVNNLKDASGATPEEYLEVPKQVAIDVGYRDALRDVLGYIEAMLSIANDPHYAKENQTTGESSEEKVSAGDSAAIA